MSFFSIEVIAKTWLRDSHGLFDFHLHDDNEQLYT